MWIILRYGWPYELLAGGDEGDILICFFLIAIEVILISKLKEFHFPTVSGINAFLYTSSLHLGIV